MHTLVFDVNVLISSLITRGKPRRLWLEARKKRFILALSEEIVSEFVKVIARRKFARYVKEEDVRVFLEALHQTATFTKIKSRFKVVKEDPDDIILRTAYDSKADYVVSGDKHLLSLGEFKGIRIVTVDEMLKILRKK
ncbi:MAG: putative toxin-antitoxin system toxin component, PIN family [Thermoproteota archaeon]|nr:putative toxin-antitoxin system toxin component, PIN family [Candidatus Brockarchaeota archaeon]